MSANKKSVSRNISLPFIVLFCTVLAFATGFFVAIKIYQGHITTQNQTPTNLSTFRQNPCELDGFAEKEQYLNNYTVKRGDTLLSISKTQLGDTSRVNEIINLNKDKYPTLSLENPFLETEWKLLLPHQRYGKTNGIINVIHGTLSKSNSGWSVHWRTGSVGVFPFEDLEKYSHLNLIHGDCITVVYQGMDLKTSFSMKALEIFKQ